MKHFTNVNDANHLDEWVNQALAFKANPQLFNEAGKGKTMVLLFLNPSLRTRLSTQKAAMNLGMQVIVMNMDKEGWALELNDHVIMNGNKAEHIKDAAGVISEYADLIGIRCFPGLQNREEDDDELFINQLMKYANVPIVSLESSTRHPLQSFADLITIKEHQPKSRKSKVVLSWAPHVRPLPQAVPNSFAEWMNQADVEFVITHPEGMELNPTFTQGAEICYDQKAAIEDADFIYVKNWSSYKDYGKPYIHGENWLLDESRLINCPETKIMHCLPVRRNVELHEELIDSDRSLILQQAENRIYAAQTVLYKLLQQ
jgi:N-succinyl-L-ornithine transcarbamylase